MREVQRGIAVNGDADRTCIGGNLQFGKLPRSVPLRRCEQDKTAGVGPADKRQDLGLQLVQLGDVEVAPIGRVRLVDQLEDDVVGAVLVAVGDKLPDVEKVRLVGGIVGVYISPAVKVHTDVQLMQLAQVEDAVNVRNVGLERIAAAVVVVPEIDRQANVVKALRL